MKVAIRTLVLLGMVLSLALLVVGVGMAFGKSLSIVNQEVMKYGCGDEVTFLYPFAILFLAGMLSGGLWFGGSAIIHFFSRLADNAGRLREWWNRDLPPKFYRPHG